MDSSEPGVQNVSRPTPALAAIFAGYIVAGIVTTLLGPFLPVLVTRYSLTDAQAGLFFTFQFGSSMLGVTSLSLLIPRCGYKFTLVAGFVALSLGVAGLNSPIHIGALAATAVFGYGLGLVLASSNLWVAEAAESERVSALSLLNLAWGVGAIASSPLVLLAEGHRAISALLYGAAGMALATALVLTSVNLSVPSRKRELAGTLAIPTSTIATIALGALFFLYVGTENSVAGWVAALAKRMAASKDWALAPMFFWGGLLAGRALVPANPLRKREKLLVQAGLILGLAGSAILLVASTFAGVATCVALAGLGFAATYPLLIAWMVKYLGHRAQRLGNIMFALASLGGATMPLLVGFLSTRTGSLRTGLLVPVAACLAMLGLSLCIPRRVSG